MPITSYFPPCACQCRWYPLCLIVKSKTSIPLLCNIIFAKRTFGTKTHNQININIKQQTTSSTTTTSKARVALMQFLCAPYWNYKGATGPSCCPSLSLVLSLHLFSTFPGPASPCLRPSPWTYSLLIHRRSPHP